MNSIYVILTLSKYFVCFFLSHFDSYTKLKIYVVHMKLTLYLNETKHDNIGEWYLEINKGWRPCVLNVRQLCDIRIIHGSGRIDLTGLCFVLGLTYMYISLILKSLSVWSFFHSILLRLTAKDKCIHTHRHTHTHIYIYIYINKIYVYVCVISTCHHISIFTYESNGIKISMRCIMQGDHLSDAIIILADDIRNQ